MLRTLLHIPRTLLIGIVRVYQLMISPFMGGACRFTPTCSEYAILALRRYGAVRGSILAIHRILRCNPWGGHGYDPPRWYGEQEEAAKANADPSEPTRTTVPHNQTEKA